MIKSSYLVNGFTNGFDLGYRGPEDRRDLSENIPLRIGTATHLWNKIMAEVKESRYVGLYKLSDLPFENFIQSSAGLVPKDNEKKTRLIFHLSFDFGPEHSQKSFNYHTPDDLCSVKYNDLDHAVQSSLQLLSLYKNESSELFYAKSDCSHAFRVVPALVKQRCWLLLAAKDPVTKEQYFFVDLCLPFGASISCAIFQSFSDALKFITEFKLDMIFIFPPRITNYLDDFLFIAITLGICNKSVEEFLKICVTIGCPISQDKTEWATQLIVFLGVLLNGRLKLLSIPVDKRVKAVNLLNLVIDQRKVTIKFIQQLTGTLNFLQKALVLGRVFTRRMYSKLKLRNGKGKLLKQHHHIWLNKEFVMDCKVWRTFLRETDTSPQLLCRLFLDFRQVTETTNTLKFYSDSSLNPKLGFGAVFGNRWIVGQWNEDFIVSCKPSIEFLELFALTAGILTWHHEPELNNSRIVVFCDNEAVVHMVNNTASTCGQCMKLLRMLTVDGLVHNQRLFAQHIGMKLNILVDLLSRLDFK